MAKVVDRVQCPRCRKAWVTVGGKMQCGFCGKRLDRPAQRQQPEKGGGGRCA